MSQSGAFNLVSGVIPGDVPIDFVTDSGTATAIANVLNVNGGPGINVSAPGSSNSVSIGLEPNRTIADWDDFLTLGARTGPSKLGFQAGSPGGITTGSGTATNPGQITWSNLAPTVDAAVCTTS